MNAEKLQLTTANYSNQINNANVRTAPVNDLNPPLQQSFACRDCNRTFHRQGSLINLINIKLKIFLNNRSFTATYGFSSTF